MTSLIFGSIYMGHHAFVNHRREKQRVKNYERWEGLRDDYDEQKRIHRETRSLDLQRTGDGGYYDAHDQRPVLTLRDQQEANDARTGWRPQESWDDYHKSSNQSMTPQQAAPPPPPPSAMMNQPTSRMSLDASAFQRPSYTSERLKPQGTGAAWDDGLPAPLRVNRMAWDDTDRPIHTAYSTPGRVNTPQMPTTSTQNSTPAPSATVAEGSRMAARPSESRAVSGVSMASSSTRDLDRIETLEHEHPGGKMAQLIEGLKTPGVEKDMDEWWK